MKPVDIENQIKALIAKAYSYPVKHPNHRRLLAYAVYLDQFKNH